MYSKLNQAVTAILLVLTSACATRPSTPDAGPTAALMRTNLEQLASAQRAYASSHNGSYYVDSLTTPQEDLGGFAPSSGMKITISKVGDGWSAVATGSGNGAGMCVIYVNTENIEPPAIYQGTVGCS